MSTLELRLLYFTIASRHLATRTEFFRNAHVVSSTTDRILGPRREEVHPFAKVNFRTCIRESALSAGPPVSKRKAEVSSARALFSSESCKTGYTKNDSPATSVSATLHFWNETIPCCAGCFTFSLHGIRQLLWVHPIRPGFTPAKKRPKTKPMSRHRNPDHPIKFQTFSELKRQSQGITQSSQGGPEDQRHSAVSRTRVSTIISAA